MKAFFNKYYGIENKGKGPFLAFSQEWFKKYQYILLLLLNLPIIKLWSRWILRIHKDCKYSDHIVEILPDNYKVIIGSKNEEIILRGDFRSHSKFSKRIYFAFRYWWWLLHYIDELFRLSYMPELNFGFDTLTSYPSTGSTSPSDGYIVRVVATEENITTISTGSGTNIGESVTGAPAALLTRGNTVEYYTELSRALFGFNTNIGSSPTISSVIFSLYTYQRVSNDDVCVVSAPTSVGTSNFNSFGSTIYSSKGINKLTNAGYTDFTLDSDGISHISKTGNTFYGVRILDELNQTNFYWGYAGEPAGFYTRYADYTGTTNDPKLVVEYSTTSIKTVMGISYSSVKSVSGILKANIKTITGIT
jgi:hypothetical protein